MCTGVCGGHALRAGERCAKAAANVTPQHPLAQKEECASTHTGSTRDSPTLSHSLSLSLSLSLFLTLTLSLSHSLSLTLSHSLSLFLTLFLTLTHFLSLSLSDSDTHAVHCHKSRVTRVRAHRAACALKQVRECARLGKCLSLPASSLRGYLTFNWPLSVFSYSWIGWRWWWLRACTCFTSVFLVVPFFFVIHAYHLSQILRVFSVSEQVWAECAEK